VLTERQFPATFPYYGPSDQRQPHKGATAEALKRAMARLGLMDWVDFDQVYGPLLEAAMAKWQKKVQVKATGQYGRASWEAIRDARVPTGRPNAGDYALDRFARALVQAEAKVTADSSEEEKVQERITEFCVRAIANEPHIGYDQRRPFAPSVDPASSFDTDCSGFVVEAFDYAKRMTSLNVPDPAKQGFSGYGNTDLYEDDHPKVAAPYRVGDLCHFFSPRHVIVCIEAGDVAGAHWASHGREAGPEELRLLSYSRYPGEFLYVVRPPLVV
jgi:hypothetical protein